MNGVGVDDGLEHEFLLQGVVRLVDDPHLLEKGRFAALGRSKQKDLNLVRLVPKVQKKIESLPFLYDFGFLLGITTTHVVARSNLRPCLQDITEF